DDLQPHPERPRRNVCFLQDVLSCALRKGIWLQEKRDSTDTRNGLFEQFQTLADQFREKHGRSRDITAWPRQAADETARHRIANSIEDNGEASGSLLGGQGSGCAAGRHKDIDLERN